MALLWISVQFVSRFGDLHQRNAQATPASVDAKQSRHYDTVRFAATYLYALDSASHEDASRPIQLKASFDHEPGGQPTDDCAICAVMALANIVVVATPPYLLGPQAAGFLYLTTDAEFVDLNSARVAFQPRAPPIS